MKLSPLLAFVCWSALLMGIAALLPDSGPAWNTFFPIAAILNAAVIVGLIRWEVARRRRTRSAALTPAGLCPSCGYDVRATPERCPECGISLKRLA